MKCLLYYPILIDFLKKNQGSSTLKIKKKYYLYEVRPEKSGVSLKYVKIINGQTKINVPAHPV